MTTAKRDFTTQLLMDAGIGEGMRVLDVGCGTGDVSFLLSSLVGESGEVVGIDHDANALAMARKREAVDNRSVPVFIQSGLLDLTESSGLFDAIVGRRVLMYQADTVAAVGALARHLRPGGVMIFQEHDTTLVPASLEAFTLHRTAQGWIQQMIAREGADPHIGFNLHAILTRAGLCVADVRAECIVQTPDAPYALGYIVGACLPRIIALGIASPDEVGIETLQQRLDEERQQSAGIYIGDVMFGAWARKPGLK
ncbi:methyltransferase domain-containing protein [Pseudomonas syringae]|nr:methyltransferase domain-containing protein [Pseudomonas syringae]MBD8793454.1 methyltransferase domain-containing protein [Pseudomonas syringae]MBD8802087.1 methyltransferase domain-containing protein [Pseudomonas syringae]MBD8814958.1 methyltransferase domain-containing protein [Pseudomonas syringae]